MLVSVYKTTKENYSQNMYNYYQCKKNKYYKDIISPISEESLNCKKYYNNNMNQNFAKKYSEQNLPYLIKNQLDFTTPDNSTPTPTQNISNKIREL